MGAVIFEKTTHICRLSMRFKYARMLDLEVQAPIKQHNNIIKHFVIIVHHFFVPFQTFHTERFSLGLWAHSHYLISHSIAHSAPFLFPPSSIKLALNLPILPKWAVWSLLPPLFICSELRI